MPPTHPLLFFGTPELAVPALQALVAAGRAPLRVVTQPPRPAGRGQQLRQPPVARWALEHGLPVLQPERVRSPDFLAELRPLAPAIAVVVAFGQIFPAELLALPALGCINLHASLLPAWRGASPIQAAISAGEARTGVTVMRMEAGLDTGPILLQAPLAIGPGETAGELAPRLAALGAQLILQALDRLDRGDLPEQPQDAALATYAPRLTREGGRVDWSLPAAQIANRLRAWTPWPGLTADLRGTPVKLVRAQAQDPPLAAQPSAVPSPAAPSQDGASAAAPGSFLGLTPQGLVVAAGGDTRLVVAELQRPGKRALRGADFVNGERLRAGERFS
jgi:methionyl-tRNA formyltransferase